MTTEHQNLSVNDFHVLHAIREVIKLVNLQPRDFDHKQEIKVAALAHLYAALKSCDTCTDPQLVMAIDRLSQQVKNY
jgi:hypothetical protein